jgi:dipeptidyl aminopeptidase/acylaminoacyl peptidase
MTRTKRRLILITCAALFGGFLAYWTIVAEARDTLLPKSSVVSLPKGVYLFEYQWSPDGSLVSFDGDFNVARLLRIDIASGVEKMAVIPQPPLRQRFIGGEDDCRVSPDGKWAIIVASESYQVVSLVDSRHFCVAGSEDREHVFIDYSPYVLYSKAAWLPNSAAWAELCSVHGTALHIVTRDVSGRVLKDTLLDTRIADPVMLGITPDDHAIIWDEGSQLVDVGLDNVAASARTISLTTPPEGNLLDVVLSPDGKRLAWRTHIRPKHTDVPSWLEWTPEKIQGSMQPPGTHIVWVSNLDGTDMREIGRQTVSEIEMASSDNNDRTFSSFRWMPDGKRLSFKYGGRLWIAPVN